MITAIFAILAFAGWIAVLELAFQVCALNNLVWELLEELRAQPESAI